MSAAAIVLVEIFEVFLFNRNSPPITATAKIMIKIVFILIIRKLQPTLQHWGCAGNRVAIAGLVLDFVYLRPMY